MGSVIDRPFLPDFPAPKCARVDIDDLCDFLSRHEALFAGIADVELSVRQQQEMPWICATTGSCPASNRQDSNGRGYLLTTYP